MAGKYNKTDYTFLIYVGLMIIVGVIMLTSASSALGFEKFQDPYYFSKHQLVYGLLPGIILFILFSKVDYHKWEKLAFYLLAANILLLVAVFIPGLGAAYGKAKSWINIFGLSLQPSEFLKLSFILYLATWLEKRGIKGVRDFKYGFMPFVILLAIVTVLVALQPDIGTMLIIIIIALVMVFMAGARIFHLIWLTLVGSSLLFFLVKIAPYRLARFAVFLNPDADPQGIGYHIKQALIAVGSGGILGRGLGQSRQKFLYLPETAGDSIYAIIAEELGLILSALIIILFIFIAIRGLKIAKRAPDVYGKLVATGIVAWIVFQSFINIAGMIDLLPMTGIPLPFISYGGTSLFTLMAAVGIMANISKQARD